jgi:hypothetical protein
VDDNDGADVRPGLAAVEAWLRTADALLCGLNHAFGNRLFSLAVMAPWGDGSASHAAELEGIVAETGRLSELLKLYHLLESSEFALAEATRVSDVVPGALALLAHHPTVRDLPCTVEGNVETPPVLLVPSALVQALLLLLCAAAAHASAGREAAGIHLSYGGDSDWVTIAVETRTSVPSGQAVEVPELPAVRWLLRGTDVTESAALTPEGRLRLELRVATLANLRSREHGG